jgi:DNA-binding GntR family transcriptional regulator
MPLPEPTATIARTSLRDAAYERLREWILDGTLAPGEPLRDEALADALGMSRTPVREALQRLEDDGLVTTNAARRSFVGPLSLQQARNVYPLASVIEGLALRLALPEMDAAALDEMRAANARLAEALRAGDALAAMTADHALHRGFVARCGNADLIRVLEDLKCTARRIERAFWGGADRMVSVRDHDELIAAIATRDLAKAEATLARNWERSLLWLGPPPLA